MYTTLLHIYQSHHRSWKCNWIPAIVSPSSSAYCCRPPPLLIFTSVSTPTNVWRNDVNVNTFTATLCTRPLLCLLGWMQCNCCSHAWWISHDYQHLALPLSQPDGALPFVQPKPERETGGVYGCVAIHKIFILNEFSSTLQHDTTSVVRCSLVHLRYRRDGVLPYDTVVPRPMLAAFKRPTPSIYEKSHPGSIMQTIKRCGRRFA